MFKCTFLDKYKFFVVDELVDVIFLQDKIFTLV